MRRRLIRLEVCEVDLDRRLVLRDDGDRTLTWQEGELLEHLASRPGRPVSRQELLRKVWGFPGRTAPETRAVDIAVRRLRQKIERDPSSPVHIVTQRNSGYRFERGEVAEEVEVETPASRGRGQDGEAGLPSEHDLFVGRVEEVRSLLAAPSHSRVVAVIGPVGAGKTRLALHVARTWAASRAVLFVPCGECEDEADLVRACSHAVGVPFDPGANAAAQLERTARVLRRRGPIALVLDGAERSSTAWPAFVRPLVDRAPDLWVVATSRRALALDGELRLDLGPLAPNDALALLLDRARAVRPGWGQGAEADVARIVDELDRVPLAIELAAHRAGVLSPRMLLAGLGDRFRLLAGADDPAASLKQALSLSWGLLPPHARSALSQLSVFRGGFTVDAAAAVVRLGEPAPWVLDWLQQLVDASWIRTTTLASGRNRFSMLESQRLFAAEAAPAERADAEARHRTWFATRAEVVVAGLRGAAEGELRAELHEDFYNFQAASRSAGDDPRALVELALALDASLEPTGPVERRRALLDRAVAAATDPDRIARVRTARAAVRVLQSEDEGAAADLQEAERAAIGTPGLARVRNRQADLWVRRGAVARARTAAEEALTLSRAAGDRFDQALAHGTLGHTALLEARLADAELHFRAMRIAATDLGSWRLLLRARSHLAVLARTGGRLAEAETEYRAALRIAVEVNDRVHEAALLDNLGNVMGALGRVDEALRCYDTSLALHQAVGNRQGELRARTNAGTLRIGTDRTAEGRDLLWTALELAESLDDPRPLGLVHGNLGVCLLHLDQPASARRHLEEAVQLLGDRCGLVFQSAFFSIHLAIAAAGTGDPEAAATARARAVAGLDLSVPVLRGLVGVIDGHLAVAAARRGEPGAAEVARTRWREVQSFGAAPSVADGVVYAVLPRELENALHLLERAIARLDGRG